MARIYTRVGDRGTTRLADGSEVPKTHPRLDACGTLDELNSHLGIVRSINVEENSERILERVQSLLFEIGSELADPKTTECRIADEDVKRLETETDRAMNECPPLGSFILPGGTPVAAHLHVARTVCRRAERQIVALSDTAPVSPSVLRFMNRLSDLLFALARVANARAGVDDVPWRPRRR